MAINKLNATDTISTSDLLPLWSAINGDDRRTSFAVLLAFMQANLTFSTFTGMQEYTTQYAVPSATGFNVQITDGDDNIHLILTPTAGYAAGTITLPLFSNCVDKQEVIVNCTQQVTALTVDGNGATAVTGEPTSLGADDFFRLKYDLLSKTWYRIG